MPRFTVLGISEKAPRSNAAPKDSDSAHTSTFDCWRSAALEERRYRSACDKMPMTGTATPNAAMYVSGSPSPRKPTKTAMKKRATEYKARSGHRYHPFLGQLGTSLPSGNAKSASAYANPDPM